MRPNLRTRFAAGLLAVFLAALATWACAGTPALTNRLIVKLVTPPDGGPQAQMSAERLERLNSHAGMSLSPSHVMSQNAWVLVLPERVPAEVAAGIAERLAADPSVEYAIPDRIRKPLFVPNDTLYDQQWSLFEDAGGVRLPDAWDRERGTQNIVVALVDSGILSHSDLNPARQAPGYDFISDPEMANDGDGRDADPADPGSWVAAGECDLNDPAQPSTWHGTLITGVIGAATDNAEGMAGVTHGARHQMARALGKCGGFTSDIVDAMRWAAGLRVPGVPDNANPARVINLSFGGDGPCTRLEQDAINDVIARGTVVIVAAGNAAGDVANQNPANCAGVVTVAATTRSGGRASYTNTGSRVDLSAPGGDSGGNILTISNTGETTPQADDYQRVAGTSFAAAHVSGIAGLMLSINEDLNPQQVHDILTASARPFTDSSCNTLNCGRGIVDANAAVQQAGSTGGRPDSDNDGVKDVSDDCPGTPGGEPVDANGCSASQLASDNDDGGGGGGGGCTLSRATALDPLLALLILIAALNLALRRARG